MSDEQNPMMPIPQLPAARLNEAEWNQTECVYRECAKAALASNKKNLFELLARHGMTKVVVHFDGYGDSGQIEEVAAYTGDTAVELPGELMDIFQPVWGSTENGRKSYLLHEAIEAMSYDFLGQTHCGWENNDGAYGDFTFDVADGAITLDYNERYTASENYMHEL